MRQIAFCLMFFVFSRLSVAQKQQEEIANAVKDYVNAFYYGDTSKIHQSVAVTVVKYGYYMPKGKTIYEGETM